MDSHNESLVDKQNLSIRLTSDEYQKYEKLMHKVARRHYGIVINSGGDEEYMDVFQNVVISFLQAKEKFNPDLGYQFSTYAVSSADKNFISQLQKRSRTLKTCSLESIKASDEDASCWQDVIADENTVDEDMIIKTALTKERLKQSLNRIKSLSLKTKLVVREIMSPSEEIQKAHKAKLAYAEKARLCGDVVPRVSEDIDYRFIFQHYNIGVKDRRKVFEEIKDVFWDCDV